jgi:hypothetical protein
MNLKLVTMMRRYFLYVLLIFSTSCTSESIPDEVIHPVPEKLPPDKDISFTIDMDEAQQNRKAPDFSGMIHSIIDQNESGLELFEVEDVMIDSDGNLYTRIHGSNSIEVYDFDGNHYYTIGRDGRGPGEFTYLWAMDFDSSFEHLYVLDSNEIEVFARSEDGQFNPKNTIYHGLTLPADICVLNDNIYVSGLNLTTLDAPSDPNNPLSIFQFNNASIHSFNVESGELSNSFGHTYQSYSGDPFLNANLSRTLLSCNEGTNTIIGLFANYGYFFGYDIQGNSIWISKIDNFKSLPIREFGINSPTPGYGGVPNSTADSFTSFRKTDLPMDMIQIRRGDNKLSTLLLDSETGEITYGGSSSTLPVSKNKNVGATITFRDDEYHSMSIQTIIIE